MVRFHFHPTPNPAKVALLLEETGVAYEIVPADTAYANLSRHQSEWQVASDRRHPRTRTPVFATVMGHSRASPFISSTLLAKEPVCGEPISTRG